MLLFLLLQRTPGHDWCILRLGNWPFGGHIHGIVLDTGYFTGNFPPKASIQATKRVPTEEDQAAAALEPLGGGRRTAAASEADTTTTSTEAMMGTCASVHHMETVKKWGALALIVVVVVATWILGLGYNRTEKKS